jgi:hypothetical protein
VRARSTIAVAVAVAALGALIPSGPAASHPLPQAPACPDLPADNIWHADVSRLPVHPHSAAYIASMGLDRTVHADFGSGLWEGGPIGIPFTTVGAGQPRVPVRFGYDDESDPGPYPIPPGAPIEGGPSADGDRHVLVVDRDACVLYELFDAHPRADGSWDAGSGAVFDLRSNALRPDTWTSADAAGLPILPGLVRFDEVAAGHVDHAIRVTARATQAAHIWPATHDAGEANANLPPMGLRLRLRATANLSGLSPAALVIATAMQRYGLIVADNGSSFFLSGAPDERWNNDVLRTLSRFRGSDFEAVDTSGLMIDPRSGRARPALDPAQTGRYVDAVYTDLLHRLPDASGRAYWVNALLSGLPWASFTQAIARSPEWTGVVVGDLYRLALDREPDPAGLAFWRDQVTAGRRVAEVAADLFGSPESWALGGGTAVGAVDRIYRRLLGRPPDAAGLAYWAAQVSGGLPPRALALLLFQSEEHRRARVTRLYGLLLGRAPDPGGLAYWTGALLHRDDIELAALLAASDEYVERAQHRF